jgi:hypothetical protein
MAELTTPADTTANSCCSTEAQATCCEPSAKAACCDPSHGDAIAAGITGHRWSLQEIATSHRFETVPSHPYETAGVSLI